MVFRERLDDERMEGLHASTLQQIAGTGAQDEDLVLSDPKAYATALAEHVTGAPVVKQVSCRSDAMRNYDDRVPCL